MKWLTKILSNSTSKGQGPLQVTAQLNVRMQPLDRGEDFEDPLDDALRARGMGSVTGGGTQMAGDPDGIAYCDVEIELVDEGAIAFVIETLERLGAPKGSLLKFTSDHSDMPFGRAEGMAIFLNGTELPHEVYATSDINEVVAQCNALLTGIGGMRGHWEGSTETALYFYGTGFAAMSQAVDAYLRVAPLCQKCRVVQIA